MISLPAAILAILHSGEFRPTSNETNFIMLSRVHGRPMPPGPIRSSLREELAGHCTMRIFIFHLVAHSGFYLCVFPSSNRKELREIGREREREPRENGRLTLSVEKIEINPINLCSIHSIIDMGVTGYRRYQTQISTSPTGAGSIQVNR